ncbi:phage holin family protein [Maliponia aquimaris]|uniref:Holin-X, holin superfamily III n=1 Tax=Maliponia aquimaris TaxID=1673631 RepID=A0A238KIK7_9RHOB|nr:phage holin family protein [Maliponia aquimaris]SMX42613.1 hypothetical protein MAA8898_02666 [Maliponia aquimaris]
MLAMIETRARAALRRGVAGLMGGVLVAIGLGFLTQAAWLALASWQGPLFAAQTLGGIYLLLGGVVLLLVRKRHDAPPPAPSRQAISHLVLAEAFLVGLDAARSARKRAD